MYDKIHYNKKKNVKCKKKKNDEGHRYSLSWVSPVPGRQPDTQ